MLNTLAPPSVATPTNPKHSETKDIDILRVVMRTPIRAKGNYARANIIQILWLIELGLLTNYDPVSGKRGGTLYLTATGSSLVWQQSE